MSEEKGGVDVHAVLKLLKAVAGGERPDLGRDEASGPMRLESGGMRGRMLECAVRVNDGALYLEAGAGEIVLRMTATGEFIFPFGTVELTARDRSRGASFVDMMADWLGTPTEEGQGAVADQHLPASIAGSYARLAIRDDADGVRWHAYKLGLGSGEVFLRISDDKTRAGFTEKWSAYREPLLLELDEAVGARRRIAPRKSVNVRGRA